MSNENIVYVPIQVNGGLSKSDFLAKGDNFLKHRELFVTNDGTLYVGVVRTVDGQVKYDNQGNPVIMAVPVASRVIPEATITNAILSGKIKLDAGMIQNGSETNSSPAELYFVDDGNFQIEDVNTSDLNTALNLILKSGAGTSTQFVDAEVV